MPGTEDTEVRPRPCSGVHTHGPRETPGSRTSMVPLTAHHSTDILHARDGEGFLRLPPSEATFPCLVLVSLIPARGIIFSLRCYFGQMFSILLFHMPSTGTR